MPLTEPLQQVDRTRVLLRGRKLSYFGGCDYFRLSSHPRILQALRRGLKSFGLNVAASRMTTGNHLLFGKLEKRLASFFGAESALLAASGYATNLIAAQALAGKFTHAFLDERSHASLLDAAALLGCSRQIFQHGNAADLASRARRPGRRARIIVLTDGMFSHDGSVAPLDEYFAALPATAWMLVDDAHGGGVLGKSGRGALEHCAVSRERIVQTISLSKAFGVYGGAVLGPRVLRDEMIARSRLFNGNTPLPLPLANAALAAVELLGRDRALRRRLNGNAAHVKGRLRESGWQLPDNPGPIVQLIPRNARHAARLKRRLLAHRVFPSLIRYSGGPRGGYFRFMISSEHTREQLDALVAALSPAP